MRSEYRLYFLVLFFSIFAMQLLASNSRLIILADMGNEPDEEQQMVHLMMYANEFDIEALIAVTGKYLNPQSKDPYKQVLHPELLHTIIDGYGKVVDNLKLHSDGWPEAEYLHSIVTSGQPDYGIEGTGTGKSSAGSEKIIEVVSKEDPRPVYIVINAGSNTLAQAILDYSSNHSESELNQFIAKIRVFENGAQDNAGAWICSKYPDIHWMRSNYQTYCYGGPKWNRHGGGKADPSINMGPYTWEPYEYSGLGQHLWMLEHVIGNHGYLGYLYPLRQKADGRVMYVEGGGTAPWLGLIHNGLYSVDHPHWGGWSGRFTKEKVKNIWSRHKSVNRDEKKYDDFALFVEASDKWVDPETNKIYEDTYTPVWRWRRAFFNDFKCRMDWCIEKYGEANHNPVAAINGDRDEKIHFMNVKRGDTITLDGSDSTDPDGDRIIYKWWVYEEPGTYEGKIHLSAPTSAVTEISFPIDASGKEIHLILEIKDDNKIAAMYDYRRIVFTVN